MTHNLFAFGLALSAPAAHAQVSFQGLGDLPGGGFNSKAMAIGTYKVVGDATPATGIEAVYWYSSSPNGLGHLPGGDTSFALAISQDDNTIVGHGNSATSAMDAWRWTQQSGMVVSLGFGTGESQARGVTSNGSVIVGYRGYGFDHRPIRWTLATGPVELGDLPGGIAEGTANAISADGSVIVGYSSSATGYQAFRWTQASGMVGLPFPPNGLYSTAYGASLNGLYACGTVNNTACIWRETQAPVLLGALPTPNQPISIAWGVSDNGAFAVGESNAAGAAFGTVAFLWRSHTGIQSLKDVLLAGGANVAGWELVTARAVRSESVVPGVVIVGWGINPQGNPEAWRAYIYCYPNCDNSAVAPLLTANDFQCFMNKFAGNEVYANCDGSQAPPVLNANDFQCFLNKFAAGCS